MSDATEKLRRSELELYEANQRLEALMEALPVGVSFSDDTSCQQITGNPTILAQFEVSKSDNLSASAPNAEAAGRQIRFFKDGKPISDAQLPLQRAVTENRVIPPMELEIHLPSGRQWFAEASGAPLRNPAGAVTGGVAVSVDITERKRAEEELRARAALLDLARDAILVRGVGDAITFWNKGAERIYGWTREEAIGRVTHGLLRTRFPKPAVELRAEVAEKGIWEGELIHSCKDGRDIVVASRWAAQHDAAGRQLGVLEINRDVTQTKRTEEALHEAQAQLKAYAGDLEKVVAQRTAKLEEMINELNQVSYAIVHDMRAPLRAMQGFARILNEDFEGLTPGERKDFLRRIWAAANRMDNLIQDVLSYNKAVLKELPVKTVDLGEFMARLIDSYPNLQPEHADVHVEEPMPAVMGNETLLTQCFSNLLGNAVKFVAPGLRPQVRVRAQERGDMVRIWVEDNGIGIPERAQARLFRLFERQHSGYEGTGMGLAIVRKVVERMGGQVGVESEVDRGSRFWVDLKLRQPP